MASSSQAIQHRATSSGALSLIMTGAGQFLATLDLFIVNIAFPQIRNDFPGTDTQTLSWVLTAYGIAFAALLVPAGRLADVYGRRGVFRLGMLIFTLASIGCAAAPSVGVLVGFRAVQAIGGALMVPTSLGLLLASFPADRHARVVGIWAAIGSVAASCGPPIGGVLLVAGWRWIFLVNVPIAMVALLLGRRLPEQRHPGDGKLPDLFGAVLLAVGIAGVVAAISNLSDWGASAKTFVAAGARGRVADRVRGPLCSPPASGGRPEPVATAPVVRRDLRDGRVLRRVRHPAARRIAVPEPGLALRQHRGRSRFRAWPDRGDRVRRHRFAHPVRQANADHRGQPAVRGRWSVLDRVPARRAELRARLFARACC